MVAWRAPCASPTSQVVVVGVVVNVVVVAVVVVVVVVVLVVCVVLVVVAVVVCGGVSWCCGCPRTSSLHVSTC